MRSWKIEGLVSSESPVFRQHRDDVSVKLAWASADSDGLQEMLDGSGNGEGRQREVGFEPRDEVIFVRGRNTSSAFDADDVDDEEDTVIDLREERVPVGVGLIETIGVQHNTVEGRQHKGEEAEVREEEGGAVGEGLELIVAEGSRDGRERGRGRSGGREVGHHRVGGDGPWVRRRGRLIGVGHGGRLTGGRRRDGHGVDGVSLEGHCESRA